MIEMTDNKSNTSHDHLMELLEILNKIGTKSKYVLQLQLDNTNYNNKFKKDFKDGINKFVFDYGDLTHKNNLIAKKLCNMIFKTYFEEINKVILWFN